MKLLHRYIFGSVLTASICAVALFVFVLLAGNALKDIVGLLAAGRLTWSLFVHLLLLLVPYVFSYALPLGILTGTLLVMGRMSARGEIVAFKSIGLSLWHLAAPVFAVALLGVGVSGFINNYLAPDARILYRDLLSNIIRHDPLRFIVVGAPIHEFGGYVLYVGNKEGNQLEDFWIWELDGESRAKKLWRAQEGSVTYDAESDALLLKLKEGYTELRSPRDPDNLQEVGLTAAFKEARIRLSLEHILGKRRSRTSLSSLNLTELLRRKSLHASELERMAEEPLPDRAQWDEAVGAKMRLQFRIQRNFAMAFSVLSLAFIGLPLGIRAGRAESHANLALALLLALTYYFLMVLLGWLENTPRMRPDLLIWLPNIVFQLTGLWLIMRANRR